MSVFIRASLILLLTVMAAQPSFAQSKKEMVAQDQLMMQRLERLEGRMLTGDPAAERLMQRMDALEENMRTLTGEVERLRFERDQLQGEIQGMSSKLSGLEGLAALASRMQTHLDAVDLIAREQASRPAQSFASPYSESVTGEPYFAPAPLTGSNGQPNAVSPAPTFGEQVIAAQRFNQGGSQASSQPSALVSDVADLPALGKTRLSEGDFAGAQTAFKQYLEAKPDAADAGEVSFWLGESFFVRGGYADAADAYISSMRKAPKGAMAPRAMVGLAATMRELGKKTEACNALGSLTSQYPNASADVREKARLESTRTGC